MSDSVRIDLTPIVRSIDQMGQQLSSQVSDVGYKVGTVANDLTVTRSELEQLKADFEAFVRTHERTRLVQLAETRLGTLKSDLEREYGHYGLVRRTSVGILQAFDIGNVRNQTVHGLSEELMIQTPKYWLAPALVALAAWSKDDEELARKSVEAAFSRDPKKTSLFFALTLRRQARLPEATRWLRHYFVSLDPRALSREFAVLLEAVAQDGFGAEGRQLVVEHLAQWRDILRDEPEIVSAQVHKWRGEILNHRGTVDDSTFSFLAHGSPDWPQVKEALEHSSAHEFVIGKYTGVRDTVTGLTASVADRLDDLLEILVSEFDEDELPLRRELIFQEAIIEHDGDADRARAAAELDVVALDERIDALSLQTHTAFRPDLFGVSAATQQIAVGSSAEDFLSAIGQFSRDYRSTWPDVIEIVLDEKNPEASTKVISVAGGRGDVPERALGQHNAALHRRGDLQRPQGCGSDPGRCRRPRGRSPGPRGRCCGARCLDRIAGVGCEHCAGAPQEVGVRARRHECGESPRHGENSLHRCLSRGIR